VARLARDPEVEALIDVYRDDLIAAGHFAENEVTSPARAFLLRIGGPDGWSRLSLDQQLAVCGVRESALVSWMITAGHVRATAEFLACGAQRLGRVAAWVHSDFHRRFMHVADGIGFTPKVAELQWWAVAKVAAVAGLAEQLSNVVDWAMKNDQAATFSSVVAVSSSVTLIPSLNVAPASTSATSSWPLNRRQRSWAASSSL
jgi:hypothetical protein